MKFLCTPLHPRGDAALHVWVIFINQTHAAAVIWSIGGKVFQLEFQRLDLGYGLGYRLVSGETVITRSHDCRTGIE